MTDKLRPTPEADGDDGVRGHDSVSDRAKAEVTEGDDDTEGHVAKSAEFAEGGLDAEGQGLYAIRRPPPRPPVR